MAATDDYLFGRRTHEILAGHWPNQPDTDMFAAALDPSPKYVVSRTLREPLACRTPGTAGGDPTDRLSAS